METIIVIALISNLLLTLYVLNRQSDFASVIQDLANNNNILNISKTTQIFALQQKDAIIALLETKIKKIKDENDYLYDEIDKTKIDNEDALMKSIFTGDRNIPQA